MISSSFIVSFRDKNSASGSSSEISFLSDRASDAMCSPTTASSFAAFPLACAPAPLRMRCVTGDGGRTDADEEEMGGTNARRARSASSSTAFPRTSRLRMAHCPMR